MYKELKRLRSRSKLYCICRKPYRRNNRRVGIACNQCDEWYHIDCVKLISVPKFYICPACKPPFGEWEFYAEKSSHLEVSTSNRLNEPKTPSPKLRLLKQKAKRTKPRTVKKLPVAAENWKRISSPDGINQLWWSNHKPYRRSTKKRDDLDRLSSFLHLQQ